MSLAKVELLAEVRDEVLREPGHYGIRHQVVADIVKNIPLSRMGQPEDLVGMCLFLLSDQARWITGQIFNVDGGQIIRS